MTDNKISESLFEWRPFGNVFIGSLKDPKFDVEAKKAYKVLALFHCEKKRLNIEKSLMNLYEDFNVKQKDRIVEMKLIQEHFLTDKINNSEKKAATIHVGYYYNPIQHNVDLYPNVEEVLELENLEMNYELDISSFLLVDPDTNRVIRKIKY